MGRCGVVTTFELRAIYDNVRYANVLMLTANGTSFDGWANWHSGKRNYTYDSTACRNPTHATTRGSL